MTRVRGRGGEDAGRRAGSGGDAGGVRRDGAGAGGAPAGAGDRWCRGFGRWAEVATRAIAGGGGASGDGFMVMVRVLMVRLNRVGAAGHNLYGQCGQSLPADGVSGEIIHNSGGIGGGYPQSWVTVIHNRAVWL